VSLEKAGFTPVFWRDNTEIAFDWFKTTMAVPPQNGMNLGVVMGPDMREMASNLALYLREDRLGVLSAVLKRD